MKKLITALAIAGLACSAAVHAQTDPKTELAKKVVALQQGPELDRLVGQLAGSTAQDLINKWGPAGSQRTQGQAAKGLGRPQRRTQEVRR